MVVACLPCRPLPLPTQQPHLLAPVCTGSAAPLAHLRAARRSGQEEVAVDAYRAMLALGLPPTAAAFRVVLDLHVQRGSWEEAIAVLGHMVEQRGDTEEAPGAQVCTFVSMHRAAQWEGVGGMRWWQQSALCCLSRLCMPVCAAWLHQWLACRMALPAQAGGAESNMQGGSASMP